MIVAVAAVMPWTYTDAPTGYTAANPDAAPDDDRFRLGHRRRGLAGPGQRHPDRRRAGAGGYGPMIA